jgi:hypothetical protein
MGGCCSLADGIAEKLRPKYMLKGTCPTSTVIEEFVSTSLHNMQSPSELEGNLKTFLGVPQVRNLMKWENAQK